LLNSDLKKSGSGQIYKGIYNTNRSSFTSTK